MSAFVAVGACYSRKGCIGSMLQGSARVRHCMVVVEKGKTFADLRKNPAMSEVLDFVWSFA